MKKKNKVEMEQPLLHSNKKIIESIEYLLSNNFAFVAFQFPFQDEFQILVQDNQNENESFLFESFDSLSKTIIKGQLFKFNELDNIFQLQNKQQLSITPPKESFYMSKSDYEQYVYDIIQNIKAGVFTKCVAARKIKIEKPDNFNITTSFLHLLSKYKGAFRYLANTSFGLWMGATPELLLQQNGNQFSTVALAGTKTDDRAWTDKEKEEQAIVTQYIVNTLKNNSADNISTSETYTFQAGHLQHLKTDISFQSNELLVNKLHPTPAVCGLPLQNSKDFILQSEKNNRSLYSGFLGLQGHSARYYVNLRCMQIFDNHIDLHVGAGITVDSIPSKEWEETEAKSEVMKKILT